MGIFLKGWGHRTRVISASLLVAGSASLAAAFIGCGDGASDDVNTCTVNCGGSQPDAGFPACDGGTPTGSLINACGELDPAAYRTMAAQLGAEQGITYRYGTSGACSAADGKKLPTAYQPDKNIQTKNGNGSWSYQVGGPESLPSDQGLDDYSGDYGQALYIPDPANAAGNPGVTDVETLLMGRNTFQEAPTLPWQGGGDPDTNIIDYQKGRPLQNPIAIGRSYGFWNAGAFVLYPNGFIGTTGVYTLRNKNEFQLPAGKVPTAVSVTNNGEFALVTIWDTINIKGQLAVFALAGSPGTADSTGKSTSNSLWGEWDDKKREAAGQFGGYPGLFNLGNVGFMKMLGFVDLPGMFAPTEISASSNQLPAYDLEGGWICPPDLPVNGVCRTTMANLSLSDEKNRNSFKDDDPDNSNKPNADTYSRSGFAVVISKSEKKAVFLDLKPLFAKVQHMYFGTSSDFALTANVGQADEQWPFAFGYRSKTGAPDGSDFAPNVITIMAFSEEPTAVRTSLKDVNEAWIGTIDGTLHRVSVGGYGNNTAATPADIKEIGTVEVGKNPTSIAYSKFEPTDRIGQTRPILHNVVVTSRGECSIKWLKFGADGKSTDVLRTLQDSRLVDPIAAEVNDTHGTESYLLSVVDYGGRQISNYRFGPVVFWTSSGKPGNSVACGCPHKAGHESSLDDGCPVGGDGTSLFEFGGAFKAKGKPFQFTEANIP